MTSHRRDILRTGLLSMGGLVVAIALPSLARRAAAQDAKANGSGSGDAPADQSGFNPGAFIRITSDGHITLIMPNTECGQGIWTSAAALIAEELEVGLDQIAIMPAPPNLALYTDPLLGEQATGGSASIRGDWKRLREAGAVARMMLITAASQRWGVEPATCRAEAAVIHHDASGRIATYASLADAAGKLPPQKDVALKSADAWKLIGKPFKRLDTPGKANGTAVFGIDVRVPGMKIGTVAACPVPGGRLAAIDDTAARRVAGVRDIITIDNAVAVIGDHMWAAKQGLAALSITWDYGKHATLSQTDIIKGLDQASRASDAAIARNDGDPLPKINAAATKLEATYELPFLSHAPMEPINCTIHARPDGADVWVGTQVPVRAQNAAASALGLKPEQVKVHNHLMGGAFGRRLDIDSITQTALIAKQVSYPVKIIWTREEDISHDLYRPYYYDRVSAGIDQNGKLVAWTHRVTGSSVMARWAPPGMKGALDPDAVECAADTPYAMPAARVDFVRAEPPGVITAWWRGVGPTHNVFVVESFIDECAAAAGVDPVDFRRRMLDHNPRARAVLDIAAQQSGWGNAIASGRGRGVSLQFAFGSYLAHVLEVEVSKRGEIRVLRSTIAIDCGQSVNPDTIRAQIEGGVIFGLSAALYSEITFEDGRPQQSNFNNYRVLRIDEAPVIDIHQIDSGESPGGIGETGTAAAAPALGNAIFAATGRRLRKLPFGNGALSGA